MAAALVGQAGAVLRDLALRSARLRGSFPVSEPGPGRRIPPALLAAQALGEGGGPEHLALWAASVQEPSRAPSPQPALSAPRSRLSPAAGGAPPSQPPPVRARRSQRDGRKTFLPCRSPGRRSGLGARRMRSARTPRTPGGRNEQTRRAGLGSGSGTGAAAPLSGPAGSGLDPPQRDLKHQL